MTTEPMTLEEIINETVSRLKEAITEDMKGVQTMTNAERIEATRLLYSLSGDKSRGR